MTVREEKEKTVKGKGNKGKGKGKGIKGACWTCNEIGHRAQDCPKKKTDMNQVGEAPEQDWEEDGFGDEDYWTVGSLQAVSQPPPGLPPVPIRNRWTVIAPDDDEDYEPNNATSGAPARNAINYPLPTSNIPVKRGKNGNNTSASKYSPIIGCMLTCEVSTGNEISYNPAITPARKTSRV